MKFILEKCGYSKKIRIHTLVDVIQVLYFIKANENFIEAVDKLRELRNEAMHRIRRFDENEAKSIVSVHKRRYSTYMIIVELYNLKT